MAVADGAAACKLGVWFDTDGYWIKGVAIGG